MDMIGRIRRLHGRKNKSARQISRITGLSHNTVAKWLRGEVDGPPKYRRGEQLNRLTAFQEALQQALKADARRPKHERRTAKALHVEIRAASYDGGPYPGDRLCPRVASSRGPGGCGQCLPPFDLLGPGSLLDNFFHFDLLPRRGSIPRVVRGSVCRVA